MHLNWRIPLSGPLQGTLPQPGFSAEAFIQAQVFGRKQVAQIADDQTIQQGHVFRQQFIPLDVRAGTGTTVTRDAQGFIIGAVVEDSQSIISERVFGNRPPRIDSIDGVTLHALATGFSAAGGTTSKTLTVDETVSISAIRNNAYHLAAVFG